MIELTLPERKVKSKSLVKVITGSPIICLQCLYGSVSATFSIASILIQFSQKVFLLFFVCVLLKKEKMGNKLCKKKSDQVDAKSPTPFDRIINRLHVSHFDGQPRFKAQ